MRTVAAGVALAGLALGLVASCGTDDDSYTERRDYLHKVAQRGVETHELLVSQRAPAIDGKRCSDAYDGLADRFVDRPQVPGDDIDDRWAEQIKVFFVDSCVSGAPAQVSGIATTPPSAPSITPSSVVPPSSIPVSAPPSQ